MEKTYYLYLDNGVLKLDPDVQERLRKGEMMIKYAPVVSTWYLITERYQIAVKPLTDVSLETVYTPNEYDVFKQEYVDVRCNQNEFTIECADDVQFQTLTDLQTGFDGTTFNYWRCRPVMGR